MRSADGRVVARLTLRAGRHAETKFAIAVSAPDGAGVTAGIGGDLDAGGSHAVFVDREVDCRLAFAFVGPSVVVAQRGGCGLPPGTDVAGRYRRASR